MFGIQWGELAPLLWVALVVVWPVWRIFVKAGYPGWYAFSMLVPVLNIVAVFYLAFAEWPSLTPSSQPLRQEA